VEGLRRGRHGPQTYWTLSHPTTFSSDEGHDRDNELRGQLERRAADGERNFLLLPASIWTQGIFLAMAWTV